MNHIFRKMKVGLSTYTGSLDLKRTYVNLNFSIVHSEKGLRFSGIIFTNCWGEKVGSILVISYVFAFLKDETILIRGYSG